MQLSKDIVPSVVFEVNNEIDVWFICRNILF